MIEFLSRLFNPYVGVLTFGRNRHPFLELIVQTVLLLDLTSLNESIIKRFR